MRGPATAPLRTFWTTTSVPTSAQDVIARHAAAQQADRNMRWSVRRDWRDAGLVSNLFPVKMDKHKRIFRYDLEVDRAPRPPRPQDQQQQQQGGAHQQSSSSSQVSLRAPPPVSPTRAWRMYAQWLRQTTNLPPVLRVGAAVFSAGPLPEAALSLPSQFHDVGWERCGLRLTDEAPLCSLSNASDLKQIMNKMLPWALSYHARNDGHFSVVREVDGKMISTEDSIAVAGLRIFRGTTAAMLQIAAPGEGENGSKTMGLITPGGAASSSSSSAAATAVPQSQMLATIAPSVGNNNATAPETGIPVLVSGVVRQFAFQGRQVPVFAVRDASGATTLTLWDAAPGSAEQLVPGTQVELFNVKAKAVDPRFAASNSAHCTLQVELQGTAQTLVRRIENPTTVTDEVPQQQQQQQQQQQSSNSGGEDKGGDLIAPMFHDGGGAGATSAGGLLSSTTLALRLDTRCSVASEKSLLDEIRLHFGDAWPYDAEQQKRITRAVQGTPAILSTNLRHTVVRSVRFDFESPEDAPMDPHVRRLAADLHPKQPYAVVHDFSVVPLQLLHCAFDPRVRSWQQVTAPACSFFPQDRARILHKFRAALADGLRQWGVTLEDSAFASHDVTVMETKSGMGNTSSSSSYGSGAGAGGGPSGGRKFFGNSSGNSSSSSSAPRPQQGQQNERPRLVSICAIRGKHSTAEELQANEKTSVSLARHFASPHHAIVDGEAAALEHVRRSLLTPTAGGEALRDPNCVAIFLSSDRDSRASRWLTAECLRRGILPYFMSGISNEKRLRLLNVQTAQNIQIKFNRNPFPPSLNLAEEVPSLAGRNVLLVGIDTCHTNAMTTGSCVGFLVCNGSNSNGAGGASSASTVNSVVPTFWQNDVRGSELEAVTRHFGVVVEAARRKAPGEVLHEVVVYQDGNVYAELEEMEKCVPAGAHLTFSCLHKRTHIRFTFEQQQQQQQQQNQSNNGARSANACKGSVVRALTPVSSAGDSATAQSFFMQCHECFTSTARTVQFMVHRQSPELPLPDLQKLTFALAHVGSPQSTKLPLPTRSAHRLSAQIERLVEASPAFRNVSLPEPLRSRCWFL